MVSKHAMELIGPPTHQEVQVFWHRITIKIENFEIKTAFASTKGQPNEAQ